MKLNKVLKYNLKSLGPWVVVTLTMWLLLDLIIPLIFNFLTGDTKPLTISIAESAMQNTIILMVFLLWYSVINQGMTIFSQFNISRKTQFIGNLLMMIFVAISVSIIQMIVYPWLLNFIVAVKPISNKWLFIDSILLDPIAQIVYEALKLFIFSLIAWFFVALIKRFSIKSVIITSIILIITILGIIIAAADFVAERIYPIINDMLYFIENNQWSVMVIALVISLVLTVIIKLLTRKLSFR